MSNLIRYTATEEKELESKAYVVYSIGDIDIPAVVVEIDYLPLTGGQMPDGSDVQPWRMNALRIEPGDDQAHHLEPDVVEYVPNNIRKENHKAFVTKKYAFDDNAGGL